MGYGDQDGAAVVNTDTTLGKIDESKLYKFIGISNSSDTSRES